MDGGTLPVLQGLKMANIDVNRKVLADMAVTDQAHFCQLVELAKAALQTAS